MQTPAITKPIALVLGANGRLGAAAVQAFAAAGWTVLAQARRAPAALPRGATHLAIDAGRHRRRWPWRLPARGGGVRGEPAVHAVADAGDAAVPSGARGGPAAERHLHAAGQRVQLRRPDAAAVERAHAAAAHHAQGPHPRGRWNPSCARWRRRAACAAWCIRAGDFFGAGSGSWMDLVITKSLRQGKLVYPGPLNLAHAWAYLPDLARAFVAVASRADELPAFADLPFRRPHAHRRRAAGRHRACRCIVGFGAARRCLQARRHAVGRAQARWPGGADVARDRRDVLPVAGAARARRQRARARGGPAARHAARRGDARRAARAGLGEFPKLRSRVDRVD